MDVCSTSRSRFYSPPQILLIRKRKTTGNWRPYSSFKQLFLPETMMWNNSEAFLLTLSALFVFWGLTAALRPSVASHNMKTQDLNSCKVHMPKSVSLDWTGGMHVPLLRCFVLLSSEFCKSFLIYSTKHNTWLLREAEERDFFLTVRIQTTKDVGIILLVNFS